MYIHTLFHCFPHIYFTLLCSAKLGFWKNGHNLLNMQLYDDFFIMEEIKDTQKKCHKKKKKNLAYPMNKFDVNKSLVSYQFIKCQ